jgi:hypothetical protein
MKYILKSETQKTYCLMFEISQISDNNFFVKI